LKIFITGASGHNGGALAAALLAAGHWVSGLARSLDTAAALDKLGIAPLRGTLDDAEVLAEATRAADVTVNAACLHPRRGLSADVGGLFVVAKSVAADLAWPVTQQAIRFV
jgi:nucleoside-diphosphate-sugar epimerase